MKTRISNNLLESPVRFSDLKKILASSFTIQYIYIESIRSQSMSNIIQDNTYAPHFHQFTSMNLSLLQPIGSLI